MDKTIEIIVVAMVTIVASGILIFIVRGQAGGFGDFADSQQNDAKCQLEKNEYRSQVCQDGNPDTTNGATFDAPTDECSQPTVDECG